jgi:DNA (cytosine-5)-methyltransferase 1
MRLQVERQTGMTDKPAYRVPSVSEINALPWNGMRVVSTFAGGGGSSLGYRMAGFKIALASEFVEQAQATYRANALPATIVDGRDIRTVTADEILQATGIEKGALDIFDGSPPCMSFSTAGKRSANWGKVKAGSHSKAQRNDDLFFEFVRLLDGLQPRAFIAENVSGLVKGVAKGYFIEILTALRTCGYTVEAKVLDAQWLGVPQARQRLIFIGIRNDLGLKPSFPKPLPYRYSIRDAIIYADAVGSIRETGFAAGSMVDASKPSPTIMAGGGGGMNGSQFGIRIRFDNKGSWEKSQHDVDLDKPIETITTQNPNHFIIEPEADMSRHATGRKWDRLKPGGQSDKYFQLVRPSEDAPCPTITASGGNAGLASVTHPTERRKFSIGELKRLCAFPDDYVLTGSYAEQWARLGNAVPPVMMKHIAQSVRDTLMTTEAVT